MEEISSEIEACKSVSAEPADITRVLARLQDEINWQFLRPYPTLDRENFFTRLWNFLLFTASHSNTSVRLAAYRTTGAFLLKVTPYYPKEIMNTFSDIALASTIDMKSSAIIASSFAFISNFTALPYLQDFLHKTPVFHHFSISDSIFSEHLSQIIRNLGRLGDEWLLTLLHCFLEKVITSKDRYLILSIAEIIKHSPLKLMNELLIFIRDNSQLSENLELISYLFSSIDCNYDTIDLGDVVEAAMKIISNISKSTSMEIDSAFQILSIKSPSFSVQIDKIVNETENQANESEESKSNDTDDSAKKKSNDNDEFKNVFVKINAIFGEKTLSDTIPVSPYLNRPSFFNLPLPLDILKVNPRDGVLQLTAKFKTMAKMINDIENGIEPNLINADNDNDINRSKKDIRSAIFNQFSSFLSASYNDMTSACMQGYALCLCSLLRHCDECNVINLTKHVIFAKPQSWFHSSDILRIIKAIPYCFYSTYNGKYYDENMDFYPVFNEVNAPFKTEAILDVLTSFVMNTNEELSKHALKATSRVIINTDFERGTQYIASKITFFDNFQLGKLLSILTSTIEANAYFSTIPEVSSSNSRSNRNSRSSPRKKLRRMSSSTFIHYYFYDVAKTNIRKSSLIHLQYVVKLVLENLADFQDETDLFIIILNFLSCFDLNFADINLLRLCFHDALWIVQASLQLLTGLQWDLQLETTSHSKAISQMIENDMKSMNYDIISETAMDYTHFLAPFAASLKFIYALPSVPLNFIMNLFSRTLDLFPYQSAMIALKYWDKLTNENRIEIILRVYPTFEFVQDYSTAAIWCHLYITLESGDYNVSDHHQQLEPCKNILHRIASYAIEHKEFYCEFYALELCILNGDDLNPVLEKIDNMSDIQSDKLINYLAENHPYLLPKLGSRKRSESDLSSTPPPSIVTEENIKNGEDTKENASEQSESDKCLNKNQNSDLFGYNRDKLNIENVEFDRAKISKLLFSPLINENANNPIIKTQLKQQTFPFTDEHLILLFRLFIQNNDISGLTLLIKYLYSQNRSISVKGMMFPSEVVPLLFRYLKKVASPDLKEFDDFYRQSGSSCPLDIRIESYVANSNEYFESLKSSPHIKKVEIAEFSRTIFRISYEQEELFNFILKLLEECTKMKRCEYVLALLNIAISKFKVIPQEIIDKFISLVKIKFDIIPAIYIANCFYSLSLKKLFVANPDFVKTAKKCYTKCDGRSSAILRLHRSIFGSQDSLNENHSILASSNLKSEIPSMIAAGSRYAFDLLQYGSNAIGNGFFPDSTCQSLVKTVIPIILDLILTNQQLQQQTETTSISTGTTKDTSSNAPNSTTTAATNSISNSNGNSNSANQNQNNSLASQQNDESLDATTTRYSCSFLGDFPVAQDISLTLTYILSHTIFKSHFPSILSCSGSLIPSNDRAYFSDFWLCLPLLISLHNEMNDELMKLIKITDTLVTKPGNFLLFKTYLMAASYRAKKALNTLQEETYLSDCITNWMQKCKEYDCYQMADFVFEWEKLIFSTNGLDQLLSIVCYQFVKYMPRFLPLYIGLSKFVRSYMKSASKADIEKIHSTLMNSALLISDRCHVLSLLLIDKKEYYKVAAELASYPHDCPESDSVIDSNPLFVQMLKEAKNI